MPDEGAEIDARAAVEALHTIGTVARATMAMAVAEAPIDDPEHAERYHHRPPGRLRESARLVFVVNETEVDAEPAAAALVRDLALARRLYRVDAEIRFETAYARRQHDQLNFKHPHGGKSKYLEHPVQVARPVLAARLREAV